MVHPTASRGELAEQGTGQDGTESAGTVAASRAVNDTRGHEAAQTAHLKRAVIWPAGLSRPIGPGYTTKPSGFSSLPMPSAATCGTLRHARV